MSFASARVMIAPAVVVWCLSFAAAPVCGRGECGGRIARHKLWPPQTRGGEFTRGTKQPLSLRVFKYLVEESLDWDSDDEGATGIKDCDARDLWGCRIFGFHPFKQIVFLENPRVLLANHFDSSKRSKIWASCA